MDLIPDTHIAIWALDDDHRLSNKARSFILDPDNDIYFSAISFMEVVIKHLKNLDEMERTGSAFYKECLDSDYYNLPLKPKHAMLIDLIDSDKHKDPFDRALSAQTKQKNMYLVTHDEKLRNYNEPCVVFV